MARRRRNPEWLKPLLIGVGGFVAGVIVTAVARRPSNASMPGAITENGDDVYYYWTVFKNDGNREVYTPMIQNARTHETFALPDEWMQSSAEYAAKQEIANRGGVAQLGQPKA